MANRSVFPCDRLRLSLCRDRLDPALRAVSRAPRVCDPSRAVCVSFFRWPRQRLRTEINCATDALQGLPALGALMRFTGGDGRCRWVVRIHHPALALAVAGIVAAAVLHLVAAPSLFRWLMPLPDTLKI